MVEGRSDPKRALFEFHFAAVAPPWLARQLGGGPARSLGQAAGSPSPQFIIPFYAVCGVCVLVCDRRVLCLCIMTRCSVPKCKNNSEDGLSLFMITKKRRDKWLPLMNLPNCIGSNARICEVRAFLKMISLFSCNFDGCMSGEVRSSCTSEIVYFVMVLYCLTFFILIHSGPFQSRFICDQERAAELEGRRLSHQVSCVATFGEKVHSGMDSDSHRPSRQHSADLYIFKIGSNCWASCTIFSPQAFATRYVVRICTFQVLLNSFM